MLSTSIRAIDAHATCTCYRHVDNMLTNSRSSECIKLGLNSRVPSFALPTVHGIYIRLRGGAKIKVLKVEITVYTVLTRKKPQVPAGACAAHGKLRPCARCAYRAFEAALRHGHAVSGIHSAASTLELKPSGKVFSQSIFTWLGLG